MLANVKQQAQQKASNQAALQSEILRRDITLIHFTHINNLHSISRNGLLLRSELDARAIDYVATDKHRFDNYADSLCLSVSFPNYAMFFKKRQQMAPDQNWVVIELDPRLLLEMAALFWPTNAASVQCRERGEHDLIGVDGFNGLFGDDAVRRKLNMPDCISTDPQAEIQVLQSISPRWIQRVCTVDLTSGLRAQRIASDGIDIAVCGDYFQPRYDFRYWKKH